MSNRGGINSFRLFSLAPFDDTVVLLDVSSHRSSKGEFAGSLFGDIFGVEMISNVNSTLFNSIKRQNQIQQDMTETPSISTHINRPSIPFTLKDSPVYESNHPLRCNFKQVAISFPRDFSRCPMRSLRGGCGLNLDHQVTFSGEFRLFSVPRC